MSKGHTPPGSLFACVCVWFFFFLGGEGVGFFILVCDAYGGEESNDDQFPNSTFVSKLNL